MKSLGECKDKLATESGFKDWEDLLESIKNDTDLINHYSCCLAGIYSEESIEESVVITEKESWAKDLGTITPFVLLGRIGDKIEKLKDNLL